MPARSWFNRTVAGMCVTSLFADMCYEMVLAVLPAFAGTIGVAAAALGWIEGGADALASFVKLGAGWYADRIGHRKGIVTVGYFLSGTALAVLALAVSWPLILLGRMVAWFGKGIRGPLRDAMLSEAAPAESRGSVFGLHRAADTTGAVLGPLLGVWLLTALPHSNPSAPYRSVFLISLAPGLLAVLSMIVLVRETHQPAQPNLRLWGSIRNLPRAFARLLGGIALFGLGDFSHTLLVLAAAQLLAPSHGAAKAGAIAALLYALRNAAYAAAAFPAGALADRMPKRNLLALGYVMGAITGFGVAAVFIGQVTSIPLLALLFAWAGLYTGITKPLEAAMTADVVGRESRGSAYGVLGSVNGVGDLVASAMAGMLWTSVSPQAAFTTAGLLMLAGAAAIRGAGPRPAAAS